MGTSSEEVVEIDYTNWRGQRGKRRILPECIVFHRNQWHHEFQWMLKALDLKSNETRFFAIKDIHHWKPCGAASAQEG